MEAKKRHSDHAVEDQPELVSEEFREFLRDPKSTSSLKVGNKAEFGVVVSLLPDSNLRKLKLEIDESNEEEALTLGVEGAKAIASVLSRLTQLEFWYNEIGDEGVVQVASALPSSQITILCLVGNEITDEGAKALASALPSCQLTKLKLYENEIGAEGAKTLASALPSCQLTKLNLGNNEIGNEGAEAVASGLPSC